MEAPSRRQTIIRYIVEVTAPITWSETAAATAQKEIAGTGDHRTQHHKHKPAAPMKEQLSQVMEARLREINDSDPNFKTHDWIRQVKVAARLED